MREIHNLIEQTKNMKTDLHGENSQCYLIDDKALLHGFYKNDHIETLMSETALLDKQGIRVPKIFDYHLSDDTNQIGYHKGWILESKMKGQPVHQMPTYQMISEVKNTDELLYNYNIEINHAAQYEKELYKLSKAPKKQYATFLNHLIEINENPAVSYDATYPNNFFYHKEDGFGFIDITPSQYKDDLFRLCKGYISILLGTGNYFLEHEEKVNHATEMIIAKATTAILENESIRNNPMFEQYDEMVKTEAIKKQLVMRSLVVIGKVQKILPEKKVYMEQGQERLELFRKYR